ncbi:hypothetical protein [Anaerosolibacter sp.]|uniref:hypothetical protein n=1 Tax=Anaerosolibacter sp. TaxID=1872527 RepID=UPI0039EF9E7F
MRELNIGEQTIRVRATPLALLYYKQEFKADLLGDLVKMADIEKDMSKLDTVAILQLVWAMAKADSFGTKFPSFEAWLSTLDEIDFSDKAFFSAVMEEAKNGFFRRGQQKPKGK